MWRVCQNKKCEGKLRYPWTAREGRHSQHTGRSAEVLEKDGARDMSSVDILNFVESWPFLDI